MRKFLVVCDLDDTLLTKKKKITRKTKRFISKFCEEGNYFIICTGRPFAGAIDFYRELNVPMPLVTDNGAAIYYPIGDGTFSLRAFDIDKDFFKNYLSEIKDTIEAAVSTSNNVISVQNRPRVPRWIIHDEIPDVVVEEGNLEEIIRFNPLLPNLWIKEDKLKDFQTITEKYKETLAYRNWGLRDGRWSIEMYSVDASKGNAMLYLAEELNVPWENTFAFGDQWNDLSMIEKAHYGVAMVNAIDTLKDASNYQTKKDCNHNGVIHFIKNVMKNSK